MVQMPFVIFVVTLVVGFLHYRNKVRFDKQGIYNMRMQALERRNCGAYLMAAVVQATSIAASGLVTADHVYGVYLFTFLCSAFALYIMHCIEYKPYRFAGFLTALSWVSTLSYLSHA